jgi:hypothetical protein
MEKNDYGQGLRVPAVSVLDDEPNHFAESDFAHLVGFTRSTCKRNGFGGFS